HVPAFHEDVPEAARAAALIGDDNRHDFDRMVEFNPAVQEGIRRWLTDMRGNFVTAYENYQYLRHRMWPHYERAGLPEALLFGILAKESGGRVHSVSRAGAAGPLQFMYATGARFGLGEDSTGFDTRYDPYAASGASVAYLNERMGELNRSIELALAAYNGGEGRARRIHRENPGKSFWHEDVYHQFPAESRDYVPMVIAAAWLFLHPKEYGLELPKVNVRPAALVLEQPASIYQLTICLGNPGVREGYMRALRNLNPRYRADDVIPAGTTLMATSRINTLYRRHCLEGRRAELARTLVNSNPAAAIVGDRVPAVAPELAPAAATAGPRVRSRWTSAANRRQPLAQARRGFGFQSRRKLRHARRQQHDHGGAVVEAGHLGETLQGDPAAAVVDQAHGLAVLRDLDAAPDRFHAGDQHRAHQHHRHGPEAGLEVADQALVAREQPRHVGDRGGADAEQPAGHVDGLQQGAGPGHVHPVVVARGQVDGREQAAVEAPRVLLVGQQLGGGEGLALGLEDPARLLATSNRAGLADAPVGGHQQCARVRV